MRKLFALLLLIQALLPIEKYEQIIEKKEKATFSPLKLTATADICTALRQDIIRAYYLTWISVRSSTGNILRQKRTFKRIYNPVIIYLGNGLCIDANQSLFFNPIYLYNLFGDQSYTLIKALKSSKKYRFTGEFIKKKRSVEYHISKWNRSKYPFKFNKDISYNANFNEEKIKYNNTLFKKINNSLITFTNNKVNFIYNINSKKKPKHSALGTSEFQLPKFSLTVSNNKAILTTGNLNKSEKKILKSEHSYFKQLKLAEKKDENNITFYFRQLAGVRDNSRYIKQTIEITRNENTITIQNRTSKKKKIITMHIFKDQSLSIIDEDENGWLYHYDEKGISIKKIEKGRIYIETAFLYKKTLPKQ